MPPPLVSHPPLPLFSPLLVPSYYATGRFSLVSGNWGFGYLRRESPGQRSSYYRVFRGPRSGKRRIRKCHAVSSLVDHVADAGSEIGQVADRVIIPDICLIAD